MELKDIEISRAIIERYTEKLLDNLDVDVAIVGAGPSGLTAAYSLASKGLKTVIFERALKPGGGMPGGGMMFSEIVIQEQAKPILDDLGVRLHEQNPGYFVADAVEVLGAQLLRVAHAGVKLFNLISVEDVLLCNEKVSGLVLNWTAVQMGGLHVDPLTMKARTVIDATGHAAEVVNGLLRKAKVKIATPSGKFEGERPMWADKAERLTLENTKEIYPGLWITGMAANACFGGPRMGPVFGGMFLSGEKVAEEVAKALK